MIHMKPTNAAPSVRSRIDLIDYVTGVGNGAISRISRVRIDPCLERAPLGPYVTRIVYGDLYV